MLMTHILAEIYQCPDVIHDGIALAEAAKTAAQSVGATIVGEYEVRYVPHGLTIAIFLGEFHIVLTTWPEFRLLLVDILLVQSGDGPAHGDRADQGSGCARTDRWWCTRRRAGSPRRREDADRDRCRHPFGPPDFDPASPPNEHRPGELQSNAVITVHPVQSMGNDMTFEIVAERDFETVTMKRSSSLIAIAKARVWASEGWTVKIVVSEEAAAAPARKPACPARRWPIRTSCP